MRPLNMSSSQAKDYYYEKDPLFEKNENSKWMGKLSEEFGLKDQRIDNKDFLNIIAGNNLKGKHVISDGVNGEHRAAIDIPFSAPKSVSIMALHAGDDRLIDAHNKAIKQTIDYIEKKYVYARKTKNNMTKSFRTENGLFATFTHSTSRANDPQLHTHSLVMNMTMTEKGLRATFNDAIFDDQKLLTSIYQNFLAKAVLDCNYQIENRGDGFFEICGVTPDWIKKFSKRTQQIDEREEDLSSKKNKNTNKAILRNIAVLDSRDKKDTNVTWDELKHTWNKEVDRNLILERVKSYQPEKIKGDQKLSMTEYIVMAANAINENESCFQKSEVLDFALRLSLGEYAIDEFECEFDKILKRNAIVHLSTNMDRSGKLTSLYTTDEMQRIEQAILDKFKEGKNTIVSTVDTKDLDSYIEKKYGYFKLGQKEAVREILTSRNLVNVIQGDAGTGKTSALKAVKNYIEENGLNLEIQGLSYTGKAAMELFSKANIESNTLHSFLNKEGQKVEDEDTKNKKIWIVDESSMIGSKQFNELLDLAEQKGAQISLIGDRKQLPAIAAGRILKDIQLFDSEYVTMSETLRQKTEHMKQIVGYIKRYQDHDDEKGIAQAFSVMKREGTIYSMKSESDRLNAAIKHYMLDNTNSLIITPSNKDRHILNQQIRNQLNNSHPEYTFSVRIPIHFRGTTRFFASNYKEEYRGFVNKSQNKNLDVGKEFNISGVDVARNEIEIEQKEKKIRVPLKTNDSELSFYKEESRQFYKGDKIVFLKNDKLLNVQNGEVGTIIQIKENGYLCVKTNKDKEISFNIGQYGYIDHGYAITVHKSQGLDERNVIFYGESKALGNNTEALYVSASRAERQFYIYTDNQEKLAKSFAKPQEKTSTIYSRLDKGQKNKKSFSRNR